ncbi:MAG TPA: DUF3499 family protein [Acidimicrobiia bacterium]|nr:DUF3499 family protein [Acidimicrobiia bacterium]
MSLCARPGCSNPAVASFNFDGLARVVWIGPLADARARTAGDLCRRHADRLTPPRHWELRDLRPATSGPGDAPSAPSRFVAPAPPPPIPLPLEPLRPARVTAPVAARPEREEGTAPEAPEHSPLLARAFRAAG